jgi:hypothetical protein
MRGAPRHLQLRDIDFTLGHYLTSNHHPGSLVFPVNYPPSLLHDLHTASCDAVDTFPVQADWHLPQTVRPII